MTSILDKLERFAKDATPGPWAADTSEIYRRDDRTEWVGETLAHDAPERTEANASYIAAASPDVTLRLVGLLRQARPPACHQRCSQGHGAPSWDGHDFDCPQGVWLAALERKE